MVRAAAGASTAVRDAPAGRATARWRPLRKVTPPTKVSPGLANFRRLARRVRNDSLVDWWSASHFAWGFALALLVGPLWSFALMVAWEPFEILLLGPLLSRWGIAFGHETWRNAASDILFDGAGAALGYVVLLFLWDPVGIL